MHRSTSVTAHWETGSSVPTPGSSCPLCVSALGGVVTQGHHNSSLRSFTTCRLQEGEVDRAGRSRLCCRAKGGVYSGLPTAHLGTQGLSALSNVGTTGGSTDLEQDGTIMYPSLSFRVLCHPCITYLECVPRALLLSTGLSPSDNVGYHLSFSPPLGLKAV